jgi:hypothetical protein
MSSKAATTARPARLLWLVAALIAVAVTAVACSSQFVAPGKQTAPVNAPSAGPQPVNATLQSNSEGGAVTVEMRWRGVQDRLLVFDVALDTHSVDLDQYDMGELTVLKDDASREYRAVLWDAPPGGHHRSGKLAFPVPDSLSQGNARYLEVIVRDVAGVPERVLRWQL